MREIVKPVITEVGKVWGRDAIFLDKIEFINESTIEFFGEFNGSLCENLSVDTKYSIKFKEIQLFKMIELDYDKVEYQSSFDLIENSKTLDDLIMLDKEEYIGKIDNSFIHYIFRTYDSVFEIIGKDFELKIITGSNQVGRR